jgi:hypothetical protein
MAVPRALIEPNAPMDVRVNPRTSSRNWAESVCPDSTATNPSVRRLNATTTAGW